jgi:hypothetical protein
VVFAVQIHEAILFLLLVVPLTLILLKTLLSLYRLLSKDQYEPIPGGPDDRSHGSRRL